MSCDHCTTPHTPPVRAVCPGCHQPGQALSTTTLLHQLRTPWQHPPGEDTYYFCHHPECAVVYFTPAGARLGAEALRQPVGQKSADPDRTLCYCFDIRYSDLAEAATLKRCRDFVIEQTRSKLCSCETHNPSGRCCLRDFPNQEE